VTAAEAEARALRWHCRRGMRELDQLLLRYLDGRWPAASDTERGVFRRLLDCEDDTLWAWCMGLSRPDDPEVHALVQRIIEPEAGERPVTGT
jgi:antitoxin CptB